jgi:beta-galactosidase
MTIWHDKAPHALNEAFGMSYQQFTRPTGVGLSFTEAYLGKSPEESQATALIELLVPASDQDVLAWYDHPVWKDYAAVTRHNHGKGWAEWIGTVTDEHTTKSLLSEALGHAGLIDVETGLDSNTITIRNGRNLQGETITYLLNYSSNTATFNSPVSGEIVVSPVTITTQGLPVHGDGQDATANPGETVEQGDRISIGPWNLMVIAGQ